MSTSIDLAFIKQFEAEVHQAYQQRGSKMSHTVRSKKNVMAKDTTFQKVGKGIATTKGRNSQVPVMNVSHTPVTCLLEDYYAGDWVDKLDEIKVNINERMVLAQAGAWALGRKTDDLIITAGMASTNVTADGGTGLTRAKIDTAITNLGDRDVPFDGDIWAAVSAKAWTTLFNLNEFASSEYVGDHPLVDLGKMQVREWVGINWYMINDLRKTGNIRSCIIYHKNAIGHASGHDVSTDITWHGDRAAHFVNSMMSQGACLIDNDGVEVVNIDETA